MLFSYFAVDPMKLIVCTVGNVHVVDPDFPLNACVSVVGGVLVVAGVVGVMENADDLSSKVKLRIKTRVVVKNRHFLISSISKFFYLSTQHVSRSTIQRHNFA